MKGYNNSGIPFVDLEKTGLLVFTDFKSLKTQLLIGAAKTRSMFRTAVIGGLNTILERKGPELELLALTRVIQNMTSHPEHEIIKELGTVVGYEYLKLKYPTLYLGSCYNIMSCGTAFSDKHKVELAERNPGSEHFEFLFEEIDSWKIFESYGRIVMFLNEHHSYTPIHYDSAIQDEFIWIPLSLSKKFFVYDELTKEKHLVTGNACTFNNADYHGSDPSPYAALSLRIDGVFTDDFRSKLKELTC